MKLSAADSAAVDKVCAAAAKCVVVVVSGRPLIIDPPQRARSTRWSPPGCRAARARAWRTRCSGARPFTGKLPVSWPRTLAQEPINVGDANYDPLYPYGYGL